MERARYQEQTCAGAGGTSERTDGANGSPDAYHGDVLANEGEWLARRAADVPAHAIGTYKRAHERAHEVPARATRTYQRTGTRARTRARSPGTCHEDVRTRARTRARRRGTCHEDERAWDGLWPLETHLDEARGVKGRQTNGRPF